MGLQFFNHLRRAEYAIKNPHGYNSHLFANRNKAPEREERCTALGEILHGFYAPSTQHSFPEDDEVKALTELVFHIAFDVHERRKRSAL